MRATGPPLRPPFPHDFRDTQELGTDLQSSPLGRLRVDLKAYLLLQQFEIDHASALAESRDVAHGQDATPPQLVEDRTYPAFLRCADENDVAPGCILAGLEALDQEAAAVDGLAFYYVIKRRPEGVLTHHRDAQGHIHGLRRPLDKTGELVKERRLHLIFVGGLSPQMPIETNQQQ